MSTTLIAIANPILLFDRQQLYDGLRDTTLCFVMPVKGSK